MVSYPVGRRARRNEDKEERRRDILEAAESLLDLSRHDLPSASAVARRAGLAKGTLYLYFRTKEEIYLALLGERLQDWINAVKQALGEKPHPIARFLRQYAAYCIRNPKTLHLAHLAPVILEWNISDPVAHAFKLQLAREAAKVGRLLAAAQPGLSPRRASRLFLLTYILTITFWQYANPPQVVARAYQDPALAILRIDFKKELFGTLSLLWKGYVDPEEPFPTVRHIAKKEGLK